MFAWFRKLKNAEKHGIGCIASIFQITSMRSKMDGQSGAHPDFSFVQVLHGGARVGVVASAVGLLSGIFLSKINNLFFRHFYCKIHSSKQERLIN